MTLKLQLYIISLFFLFALLFINKVPVCWGDCEFVGLKKFIVAYPYAAVSLVMMILGLVYYWKFDYYASGSGSMPDKVVQIESQNFEHLTFLATYVIPLLTFDLDFHLEENRNGLMFFLVLIVIGMIYIRTNMYYTNPTLAIFGYHIYKVDCSKESKMIIITREVINEGDHIVHRLISDNVYFAKIKK
jgi:hypothetical protein